MEKEERDEKDRKKKEKEEKVSCSKCDVNRFVEESSIENRSVKQDRLEKEERDEKDRRKRDKEVETQRSCASLSLSDFHSCCVQDKDNDATDKKVIFHPSTLVFAEILTIAAQEKKHDSRREKVRLVLCTLAVVEIWRAFAVMKFFPSVIDDDT